MLARIVASVACLVLSACSGDEPDASVDVAVSEVAPGLAERPDELLLTVVRLGGGHEPDAIVLTMASIPSYRASDGLLTPWVVTVRPRAQSDAGRTLYRFRVSASRAGRGLVLAQARMVFLPHSRVVLPMRLERACENVACPAEETCVTGTCMDDEFDPCAEEPGAAACRSRLDASAPRIDGGTAVEAGSLGDGGGGGGPCLAPGLVCDGTCTTPSSDPANCGACGNVCSPGSCIGGRCICGGGAVSCAGGCADLLSDPANCGGCGDACPPSATCSAGVCRCPAGSATCPTGCSTLTSDPQNCGSCDQRCPSGATCRAGSCMCSAGSTACPSGCTDVFTDPSNCGACGTTCSASQRCLGGMCIGGG